MKKRHILLALCGIWTWASLSLIPARVTAEITEVSSHPMKPGSTDRCPVCGMFPHKFPKWVAGLVFQSGSQYFHCSPKCMLHNLHNVPKYQPDQKREHIKYIWVTEYYTTKQMDAHAVLFVTGSSLVGPMGLDLIPVKGRDAAEQLKKDYGGEAVLALDEVSPDEISKARSGRLKTKGNF